MLAVKFHHGYQNQFQLSLIRQAFFSVWKTDYVYLIKLAICLNVSDKKSIKDSTYEVKHIEILTL